MNENFTFRKNIEKMMEYRHFRVCIIIILRSEKHTRRNQHAKYLK